MAERIQKLIHPDPKDQHIQIADQEMTIHFLEGESQVERALRLKQKLIPREEVEEVGKFLRNRNLRVSYTSGAYDIIHKGHARYLNLAHSLGDVLFVGLNSDFSIQGYKGPHRPILGQEDRAEMLSFLESVDYLTIYDEPTGAEVIRQLKPDAYLCVEGSWEGDIAAKAEVIAMAECGGQVFYTPRQNPLSSTSAIIESIGQKYGSQMVEDFKEQLARGGNGGGQI